MNSGFIFEEDVVGAVRVEGWIQVDQIHGFIGDVVAEDIEVVTVVKSVHLKSFSIDLQVYLISLVEEYMDGKFLYQLLDQTSQVHRHK